MLSKLRIFLLVSAIDIVLVMSCLGIGLRLARMHMMALLRTDTEFAAELAGALVSNEISRLFDRASLAADALRGAGADARREEWAALGGGDGFTSLALLDGNGVIARCGEHAPDADMRDDGRVRAALGGVRSISSAGEAGGDPVFRLYLPAPGGRALIASVPGTWFSDMLTRFRPWGKGHVFILDGEGALIAGPRPEEEGGGGADADPVFAPSGEFASLDARGGSGWYELSGREHFCVYRPISGADDGWMLVIAGVVQEIPAMATPVTLLVLGAILLIIGITAAFVAADRISRSAKALMRKQEQLDSAAKISRFTYWEWDCINDIIRFSDHIYHEYGYRAEELTAVGYPPGKRSKTALVWRDLIHPEDLDSTMKALNDYFTGKAQLYQAELRMRHKNGHYMWVLASGRVIEWVEGRPALLTGGLLNINDLRQAERMNKAKSDLLATVSHEIRTPLNTILGISEIQMQKPLPEGTYEDIEKIYYAGANLLGIINDMLDISKAEAGSFALFPDEYNVAHLINDVVQLNIVRIESKPVTFSLNVAESLPERLYGDELRIKQIFNNLLSNAFKYTREGSVHLDIGWEEKDGGTWLVFSVSDTGIGIRQAEIAKIFLAYTQLDMKANRAIEGTGLGLFITKKLVEMMDGEISATSRFRKGSVFRVRLRQIALDNAPLGRQKVEELQSLRFLSNRRVRGKNIARAYMPYGKVLVVDDVATNLDVAKGLLLPYGLTVDLVASGQEAVEKIRSGTEKYDVVFMDHMMPRMDGLEATRIIRQEIGTEYARTVPIIALTANALVGTEKMFLENGFNGFISKPIDLMRMDTVLNKWIRDKQSKEKLRDAEREKAKLPAPVDSPRAPVPEGIREAGLDWETGVQRCGSEEAYRQILRSYARHTPELLDKMRDPRPEDLPAYAVTMHGVKGSSYSICAGELAGRAESLEMAAKAGDFMVVQANNASFLDAADRLLARIGKLLEAEPEREEEKPLRPAPDDARLERLLEACRRFETTGMEEIMAELERFRYTSGGELVAWLREQMDRLEYEAILERLENRQNG